MNVIKAFTDGSCSGNQTKDKSKRKAGCGVYFKDKPESLKNVSYQLVDNPTNNRAEIKAVILCFDEIMKLCDFGKEELNLIVVTDSKLVFNIVNGWIYKWAKNEWKKSNDKEIKNKDLIIDLYQKLLLLKEKNVTLNMEHIRSHQKEPEDTNSKEWDYWYCNEMADQLAKLSYA